MNHFLFLFSVEEPNESLPPSGYVVAGKMRLGSSISVPAPNSAHLRRETQNSSTQLQAKKLPPFRTESINSSASNASSFQVDSSNSERESISPSRIHEDQVKINQFSQWEQRCYFEK